MGKVREEDEKALKMAREYTDRGEAQVVGEYEAAK